MKILVEVKRIIEEVLELPFMYEDNLDLNNWLSHAPLPCVACLPIVDSDLLNVEGVINESTELRLMFIDKTEWNYTATENQEIIDENRERAFKFLREVAKSDVVSVNSQPKFDYIYNEYDILTTGVALKIVLQELSGYVKCFEITQ